MKTIFYFSAIALILSLSSAYPQWIQQTLPGDIDVTLGIDFIDHDHGLMGGWHFNFGGQIFGNAFYTTNSGTDWFEANFPDSMRVIVGVQMFNNLIAFGAGAYNRTGILSPTSSNHHQDLNPRIRKYYEQLGMDFSEQQNYRGYFVETTDGGLTWHPKGSFEDSVFYLVGISFIDLQTGCVLASGSDGWSAAILKTFNSGNDWSYVFPFEEGLTLNDIKFFNHLNGMAVGSSSAIPGDVGIILRTTDGGDNWIRTQLPSLATIDKVAYYDISTVLISGVKTDFSSVIYKSDDSGISWVQMCNYGDLAYVSGINTLPGSEIIIVFGQEEPTGSAIPFIEVSLNGGYSWYYSLLSQFQDYFPFNSEVVNEARWYLTGTSLTQLGFVLFTDNSGGVPVELISFTADVNSDKVLLQWQTATELNNLGFEIERKSDKNGWRMIGFKEGKGTTTEIQNYVFSDDLFGIESEHLYYRLKQIDFDGTFEYSEVVEVVVGIPTEFSLEQNYPNPFNPLTTIRFTISDLRFTVLKVYDVLGNEIAILVNEEKPIGIYEVEFNATTLPSGIYFYKLRAGDFIETRKMVLIK